MDSQYKAYFLKLINKYNKGVATEEELSFLESFDNAFDLKDDFITEDNEASFQNIKSSIKAGIDNRIDLLEKKKQPRYRLLYRYAAAAIILLAVSVTALIIRKANNQPAIKQQAAVFIHPGGNRAVLTLSNGTSIVLDNAHNGQIAKQSNVNITKIANNEIVYADAGNGASEQQTASSLQNTISTPNGGQYQLVLPDGTKATLNAASSLTYPAEFRGAERVVQLNGEAYFEVAKNKKMPFRVIAGNQVVEVLGTHFNINAYKDEASVKTTLLQGSVKVSSGENTATIVPGEQALTNAAQAGAVLKRTVDVDKETAWKNGLFSFENEDLKSIMRQVARWYDVKIVYAANLPDEKFVGEIPRASNLSDVFKILELNDVRFDVKGKTVTVSAKK